MTAIYVDHLSREFNGERAVINISFSVASGEIFGLLGPNGAGKTTTIRMLTGQLNPNTGDIRVAGCELPQERKKLWAKIGVVFEYQNLYERMTGFGNLNFAAHLYSASEKQIDNYLHQVDLWDSAKNPVNTYSNGMKQRLLIARALLHQPQILFLDEPTRGLDPRASLQIRHLIRTVARHGTTVFLTTHYMEEADQLCDRVAFLDKGEIKALDSPDKLKLRYGERKFRTKLVDGQELDLRLNNPNDLECLHRFIDANQILTLHSCEATLEDVFIKLTG